jgi:hypothetical protein
VRVQAPDEPGSYVLEVLGVREHLHWFRRTDDAHAAAWTVNPSPRRWAVSGPSTLHGAGGEDAVATLALTNAGATPWDPELGDRLAYRIVDAQGREVVREGRRTMLPGVVPPGTAVAVSPRVRLPTAPGRYRLTWALVRESVAWFPAAVVGGEVELVVDAPALAWALVHAEGPASLWVGRSDTMRVTLVNVGTETWSPELADRVTYRVLDADGHIVIADGARTQLPADVAPGESIELDVMVAATTSSSTSCASTCAGTADRCRVPPRACA